MHESSFDVDVACAMLALDIMEGGRTTCVPKSDVKDGNSWSSRSECGESRGIHTGRFCR